MPTSLVPPAASPPDLPSSDLTAVMQAVIAIPYMQALNARLDGHDKNGVTLILPYRDALIGDPISGSLAPGALTAVMDQACGMAVWQDMGQFVVIATLDLRIDHIRAARPGQDVRIHALCFRTTRSIAFVRGVAFDSDPGDPVAAAQAAFAITHSLSARPEDDR